METRIHSAILRRLFDQNHAYYLIYIRVAFRKIGQNVKYVKLASRGLFVMQRNSGLLAPSLIMQSSSELGIRYPGSAVFDGDKGMMDAEDADGKDARQCLRTSKPSTVRSGGDKRRSTVKRTEGRATLVV